MYMYTRIFFMHAYAQDIRIFNVFLHVCVRANVWYCAHAHMRGIVCAHICMGLCVRAYVWDYVYAHMHGIVCEQICIVLTGNWVLVPFPDDEATHGT